MSEQEELQSARLAIEEALGDASDLDWPVAAQLGLGTADFWVKINGAVWFLSMRRSSKTPASMTAPLPKPRKKK